MKRCEVKSQEKRTRGAFFSFFVSSILLWNASEMLALPIYRTMISAKKRELVNCTLCHQPDGWEINKYGKDFLKEGRSFQALEILDSRDSDQDGIITSEEWRFLSNPGDPASKPKNPGNWLKESKPTFPPKKILSPLFPGTISYRVQEEPLSEKTVAELEKILGKKLQDEEKYPTLFWVLQDQKPVGLSAYSLFSSHGDALNIVLTIVKREALLAPTLRILKIYPQHLHLKAMNSSTFLKQFSGKNLSELSQVQPLKGLEKESQGLIDSVKTTLTILEKLFP